MDEDCKKAAGDERDGAPAPGDEASREEEGEAAESQSEAPQTGEVVIRPYEGKVGEARGNLRAREGWFRRRTGSGK
jgi:hypothetical protein